ncbi:allophanate hydrolase [Vibrio sp. 10N.286.49.B3]|nr:allophanate hydrolase [Vibrio sp. 10N.286.49.B3]
MKTSQTKFDSLTTPMTISQLIKSYKSGDIDVATYLKAKWVQVQNDDLNAWISTISEQQIDMYIESLLSKNIESLPLFGVPFAIKDNIDFELLPTTGACEDFRYTPESSAFVVELLIAAGAVPLGKTNLDQFATGLVGTRSSFGETKNSFDADYISGGSSSGSAVSVATDQVMFSLGTDTAGSGRVPAAFNNLYGFKASKGMLSCTGVIPACRSLDCVSIFTKSAQDLPLLYSIAGQYDEQDCYARKKPEPCELGASTFSGLRIGIPSTEQLAFFGNEEYSALYQQSARKMASLGAELVPFDLSPFLEAATLLYQGPWVAERYVAIEDFFKATPEVCLPVIQDIIGGAEGLTAADTFKAIYKLQEFKVQCDKLMQSVDVVLTPTVGTIYTIDEVNAEPIRLNSNLGYYTNFMNLLDFSAVAVPADFDSKGLPFGVTLFAPAFCDDQLLSLASEWDRHSALPLGSTGISSQINCTDIMVCGAHMEGLPLNYQLVELGGTLKQVTKTSNSYRLFKLAGSAPFRPGLIRDEENGAQISVEIWSLPTNYVGQFLANIPHPLGLGSIELESGKWVKGFICEPIGIKGAEDVTHYGGWRQLINQI